MLRSLSFIDIAGLICYLAGGISVFAGVLSIVLAHGRQFYGLASGGPVGFVLVATGLVLSIAGLTIVKKHRARRGIPL